MSSKLKVYVLHYCTDSINIDGSPGSNWSVVLGAYKNKIKANKTLKEFEELGYPNLEITEMEVE